MVTKAFVTYLRNFIIVLVDCTAFRAQIFLSSRV